MKRAVLFGALQLEPKYTAVPETHEVAKRFYKQRGLKLKDVIDALLLWNMERVELAERIRVHSNQRIAMPVGLALPKNDRAE